MSFSKISQDSLCEVLSFCTRIELEYFSISSRLLNRVILKNYPSKPYLVVERLIIRTDEGGKSYYLEDHGRQWHPRLRQFSGDDRCSPNYRIYYSLAEMRPYLGQNVRVKRTTLRVNDQTVLRQTLVTEMESLSHIWRDQTFSISSGGFGYLTDALFQQVQPILNSRSISQFRELKLSDINFSLKDYPVLYSIKELRLCNFNQLKHHVNLLHFLDVPKINPLIVYDDRRNLYALINLISESFSRATLPSEFKIVLMRDKRFFAPVTEFREANNISGEVLKLEKGIPEEYKDKCSGSFDYYTLQRCRM